MDKYIFMYQFACLPILYVLAFCYYALVVYLIYSIIKNSIIYVKEKRILKEMERIHGSDL